MIFRVKCPLGLYGNILSCGILGYPFYVNLQQGIQDRHIWRLSSSGQYTDNSVCDAQFQDAILFEPCERIWKSRAPPKCNFFMWLVAHNRCWIADRLENVASHTQLDHSVIRWMRISNTYSSSVSLPGSSGSPFCNTQASQPLLCHQVFVGGVLGFAVATFTAMKIEEMVNIRIEVLEFKLDTCFLTIL
jgi:hypothetical protein